MKMLNNKFVFLCVISMILASCDAVASDVSHHSSDNSHNPIPKPNPQPHPEPPQPPPNPNPKPPKPKPKPRPKLLISPWTKPER
ncbi:hypothetical protein [Candidatus Liberibacter brunswickensis]|uniref:hypothetical protein n=1 Tax=Candidatus Liberibacter brunswickensis TaxID=1968796 RepID=UPI002FE0213A